MNEPNNSGEPIGTVETPDGAGLPSDPKTPPAGASPPPAKPKTTRRSAAGGATSAKKAGDEVSAPEPPARPASVTGIRPDAARSGAVASTTATSARRRVWPD